MTAGANVDPIFNGLIDAAIAAGANAGAKAGAAVANGAGEANKGEAPKYFAP